MLTAAAGCAGLEAEPCSRGALRSGLSWSACLPACLPDCGCLLADEVGGGSVRFYKNVSGGTSGMDRRAQWGAATRFDKAIDSFATDTEDNSRPGTALHDCPFRYRMDVALFVRAEWEREPPQSWGSVIRPIDNAIFFLQWGPKDRHRDLACGNRKLEPYCLSPALAAGADSPLARHNKALGPRLVAAKAYVSTSRAQGSQTSSSSTS